MFLYVYLCASVCVCVSLYVCVCVSVSACVREIPEKEDDKTLSIN